ncbi:metalloprotease PmbA [Thioalkalivibrio sp. HK1]|uniref:metalloprotease PmbA n=1 Tax=Thioalkalivibrio sp. HK1 TaxID=1469245 RepID=UPI001E2DB685|nr:metalloprotease PmbA [Thioalkalivibrio sp. HK1]
MPNENRMVSKGDGRALLVEDDESPDMDALSETAAMALEVAKELGASAAETSIRCGDGLHIQVRMGEVETIEHTQGNDLGITVYFGHSTGSAGSTDFGPKALRETVEAACRIARHTTADEYSGLADADLMAVDPPDLDLMHPWPIEMEEAIEIALQAEDAARQCDERITNSEGAVISRHRSTIVYGNSHGFLEGFSRSSHGIGCTVIAQNDSGMQRDHWYSSARNPKWLEDPSIIGRTAAQRTLRRLDARKISTRNAPVLFEAQVARRLIGQLVEAVSGSNLHRNASFLSGALDKQVMASHLHLYERPHLPGGNASAAFDNEGVATDDRDLVRNGVLCGYVLDSYSARKLGTVTTGNAGGIHNLTVEAGTKSFDDLVAEMGEGLIVTEMIGHGANIVTGDLSVGAVGLWVENQAIAFPVEEITIAGNLSDIFLGICEIGNDIDSKGAIRTGSILTDRITIAGN